MRACGPQFSVMQEQAREPFAVARRRTLGTPPVARGIARFGRDEILAAIRTWAERYGGPPTLADWEPSRARRLGHAWRAERFCTGEWPTAGMVAREFGTFGAGIAAAGFERPRAPLSKPRLTGSDEVLRALRAWTARYGEPPAQADWDPVRARALGHEWRIERYHAGDWPSLKTVRNHFGSLGAAVRAAGLEPAPARQDVAARAARRRDNRLALVLQAAGAQRATGPDQLARPLRAIAAARRAHDDEALEAGLVALAAAALHWAEDLRWAPEDEAA
jgi:hypothetical protein